MSDKIGTTSINLIFDLEVPRFQFFSVSAFNFVFQYYSNHFLKVNSFIVSLNLKRISDM